MPITNFTTMMHLQATKKIIQGIAKDA